MPSASSPTRASQSGMEAGRTPNFSTTPSSSQEARAACRSRVTTRVPRTHWARSLSGEHTTTCSTSRERRRTGGARGQGVVGLELHHRPHHEAEGARGVLGGMELGQEVGGHAFAGLVAGEEVVAERLDDVVEGHRHVA